MKPALGRNPAAGFTLLEIIVVIAIIGLLISLALPAVQKARQASLKATCLNKLHQIGIAMISHHDTRGAFPPGFQTTSNFGIPFTSWRVNLLPFLEEGALHRKIIETPFNYPVDVNYFAFATPVKAYWCPENPLGGNPGVVPPYLGVSFAVAHSDYLGVTGVNRNANDGVLFGDSQIRMADIKDGSSHTLLAGERPPSKDGWFGQWFSHYGHGDGTHDSNSGVKEINLGGSMEILSKCPLKNPIPYQAPKNPQDLCSYLHFWSYHSGGANFLFVDGSARLIPYTAAPTMEALATRAGGEPIGDF